MGCYKAHQDAYSDKRCPTATLPDPNGLPPKPPPVASGVGALGSHPTSGDSSTTLSALDSLESSVELKRLYVQYPKLRNQLSEIYEASNEPSNDHSDEYTPSRGRGDRYRGRGRIRERGHERGVGASWPPKKRFEAGLDQMRKSRHLRGTDGEGLKEFSKLVVSLTEYSTPKTAVKLM